MDILNCLSADYDEIRARVIELQLASSELESSEWDAKFREFVRSHEIMSKAEAAVLGYATNESEALEQSILALMERNTILEELAFSYRLTSPDGIRDAKARVYLELVTERLESAEREIFPIIFDQCTEDERDGMGRSYQRYKSIAQGPGITVSPSGDSGSVRAVI